jgi:hypothetical protein
MTSAGSYPPGFVSELGAIVGESGLRHGETPSTWSGTLPTATFTSR